MSISINGILLFDPPFDCWMKEKVVDIGEVLYSYMCAENSWGILLKSPALKLDCLDLYPDTTTYHLCDFGKTAQLLCTCLRSLIHKNDDHNSVYQIIVRYKWDNVCKALCTLPSIYLMLNHIRERGLVGRECMCSYYIYVSRQKNNSVCFNFWKHRINSGEWNLEE
jgi:hypothetical protein